MSPEPLDDLLDRSAPVVRRADDATIAAMIADAREMSVPRRRRRRLVVAGGVLTALLVGGAGIATAAEVFDWGSWLEDPVGEYALTLPSGLECTVRIAHYTAADPAVAHEVNRIVEDWWRSTDVAAATEPLIPQMIDQIRAADTTVYIAETGETVPGGYGTDWYDADQEYHFAFANAVGELEHEVLGEHGISTEELGAARLEGGYGIKCLDASGEVTIP